MAIMDGPGAARKAGLASWLPSTDSLQHRPDPRSILAAREIASLTLNKVMGQRDLQAERQRSSRLGNELLLERTAHEACRNRLSEAEAMVSHLSSSREEMMKENLDLSQQLNHERHERHSQSDMSAKAMLEALANVTKVTDEKSRSQSLVDAARCSLAQVVAEKAIVQEENRVLKAHQEQAAFKERARDAKFWAQIERLSTVHRTNADLRLLINELQAAKKAGASRQTLLIAYNVALRSGLEKERANAARNKALIAQLHKQGAARASSSKKTASDDDMNGLAVNEGTFGLQKFIEYLSIASGGKIVE